MAGDTKERIMEAALELFAQKGYLGTSMSDIAKCLGITKAALYKHYVGKEEILESIVARMNELDLKRAESFAMPVGSMAEAAEEYQKIPAKKIRLYSREQFFHWTKEKFSAQFRRMLTLEEYRDQKMAALYQEYLTTGPLKYMTAIFERMGYEVNQAEQLALEFYAPIYMLYGIYDLNADKEWVERMLDEHIDRFILRLEFERRDKWEIL